MGQDLKSTICLIRCPGQSLPTSPSECLSPGEGSFSKGPTPAELFGHQLSWGMNQDSWWGGGPLEAPGRSGEQLESKVNSPVAERNFFIPGWLEIC